MLLKYDEKTSEIICEGVRYKHRKVYARKDCRKIQMFYNTEIKKKKDVPFYFRERLRKRDKMGSEEWRSIYAHRKITVEPFIGNIKQNIGLREFWMRGKEKVKVELNISREGGR